VLYEYSYERNFRKLSNETSFKSFGLRLLILKAHLLQLLYAAQKDRIMPGLLCLVSLRWSGIFLRFS